MLEAVESAIASVPAASPGTAVPLHRLALPRMELPAFTRAEVRAGFGSGELEVDACEQFLASASRVLGTIDVAIAEGLDALRTGDRLERLACHLDDFARE